MLRPSYCCSFLHSVTIKTSVYILKHGFFPCSLLKVRREFYLLPFLPSHYLILLMSFDILNPSRHPLAESSLQPPLSLSFDLLVPVWVSIVLYEIKLSNTV